MLQTIKNEFDRLFGEVNQCRFFFSPGRVNIIGEHIDYNGGYVLPCAIDKGTYFAIKQNNLNKVRAYSLQFPQLGLVEFLITDTKKTKSWTDFIKGVIKVFGIDFGFDLVVGGNIPHSSGLSSSASFCTGLALGLTSLKKAPITGSMLALMCKKVENEFMRVNCGIMDQFIVCNGHHDHAILLQCDTLKYKEIPFNLMDCCLLIANTNKKRQLADSKYNERKAECDAVLKIIRDNGYKYDTLCDVTKEDYSKILPLIKNDILCKRFKHVYTENQRTIEAAKALSKNNITRLGELLDKSHASLKNDYEVSGIELDTLVSALRSQPGCIGSRMTGAGFGGCAIAIFQKNKTENVKAIVSNIYKETIGYEPSFYDVEIGDGAKEIW